MEVLGEMENVKIGRLGRSSGLEFIRKVMRVEREQEGRSGDREWRREGESGRV